MADRQTSDPRRESGERRQISREDTGRWQPVREGTERRQPPRESTERRQPPREGAERRQPSREGAERRQPSREGVERRQGPRRIDVIRCENCGEDYAITYKRCPFCDERPGRGGGSGKRVANTRGGGYGRPVNPIQVVWLIISLVLIISALFIVFRFIGSPLFGSKKPGTSSTSQGNTSSSQSGVSSSQGNGSQSGSNSTSKPNFNIKVPTFDLEPDPPAQGKINATGGLRVRSGPGKEHSALTTLPNGSTVSILGEENGWYQIQYGGSNTGYVSKEFVSTSGTSTPSTTPPSTNTPSTTTPTPPAATPPSSGAVTPGTKGIIINADTGLNIRSGPGREYDVVASASNGGEVTIQGEENGWYKVAYNGSNTGYVSKDFVSIR